MQYPQQDCLTPFFVFVGFLGKLSLNACPGRFHKERNKAEAQKVELFLERRNSNDIFSRNRLNKK